MHSSSLQSLRWYPYPEILPRFNQYLQENPWGNPLVRHDFQLYWLIVDILTWVSFIKSNNYTNSKQPHFHSVGNQNRSGLSQRNFILCDTRLEVKSSQVCLYMQASEECTFPHPPKFNTMFAMSIISEGKALIHSGSLVLHREEKNKGKKWIFFLLIKFCKWITASNCDAYL